MPTGYTCYQGDDLKQNPIIPQTLFIEDDQVAELIAFKPKVKFVCYPTAVEGGEVPVPPAPLVCYFVKAAAFAEPQPKVNVVSQFQLNQFRMKKAKLLCTFDLP